MCGRFTLTAPGEEVAEALGMHEAPALTPRYNIAPTQPVLAVRLEAGVRKAVWMRWGLVPRLGRVPERPLINARAETVATLPSFQDAFRGRRCLVPADGFYEWQSVPGRRRKTPYHIRRDDGRIFAFAGLWEPANRGAGASGASCAILTTEPNELMRPIHDRMPVILAPALLAVWLDPAARRSDLERLLRPAPVLGWAARPVGSAVNDARYDGPDCLSPPAPLLV